jgi:formyltetrahydrofolate synthetase
VGRKRWAKPNDRFSGAMMLMPGLPKASRVLGIDVDEDGEMTGM